MELPVIKLFNIRLTVIIGLCLLGPVAIATGDTPAKPERYCNPMVKPHPECLPQPSTRPVPSAQPALSTRQLTPEQIERDKQRQKERAERAGAIPPIYLTPEEIEKETQWAKDNAWISLENNGQTLSSTADGSKGSIFLDDERYPVRSLTLTCKPQDAAAIGEPRYGSRGPDLYPVWIVTFLPGKCVLRNKDFSVNVVIQDLQEE